VITTINVSIQSNTINDLYSPLSLTFPSTSPLIFRIFYCSLDIDSFSCPKLYFSSANESGREVGASNLVFPTLPSLQAWKSWTCLEEFNDEEDDDLEWET
jgi:hypothetical protein